jgi:hypothetical protein
MRWTRTKSDLEVLEEDFRFTAGGFSKGNDVNARLSLDVNDRKGYAPEQP